ncbi:uncharacterized protein [Parasteatoda tepidariorum]|uniref:uncharacterized protein isoform X1 n=1 Tax=Parasteatoda tepidariorum TaxID=114398 RepID=UPI001C71845A|nr:uncharacterized protein LOC107454000 isoform X1 [Parasteatoda tepidariorum]
MFEDDRLSKTEDKKSLLYSENSIGDDELKQKGRMFDDNLPSKTENKNFLFYSPASKSDDELKQKGGKWLLFAHNDLRELDQRWVVLQNLCNNGTLAAIKSSTVACSDPFYVTVCYTTDPNNQKEVKYTADEIRKLVDYKLSMYYKASKLSTGLNGELEKKEMHLYEHTVNGEFYKKEMDDLKPSTILWKPFTTFIGACGKKEEGRLRDGKLFDETHRITFTEKTMKKRGRWTLHSFGDLDQIDHRWEVLKSLCESGVLASIISSTGTCNPRKGVTKCFTSDFENTKEVLRAAKEIRNLIDYEYVMYYATAEKTSGIEVMYNTRYIYTVKGGFYGKDKYMRWISLMT